MVSLNKNLLAIHWPFVPDPHVPEYGDIFKKGTKLPYLYIINTIGTWINVFMVLTSYETITH